MIAERDQPAGRDPRVLSDREAGFASRLRPGSRPAVIMVDLVRAYFEPGAELYMGADGCLRAAAEILAAARRAGILVIHTRVTYSADGLDGGHFFRKVGALKHFVGETPLGQTMLEVAPIAGELTIIKQYASAFFGTTLASVLSSHSIDTLIVTGVSTSGCVRATAVDAIQHGFIPLIARDAVGDRHDGPHDASLFDLQAKYAEVLSQSEILAYLLSPR